MKNKSFILFVLLAGVQETKSLLQEVIVISLMGAGAIASKKSFELGRNWVGTILGASVWLLFIQEVQLASLESEQRRLSKKNAQLSGKLEEKQILIDALREAAYATRG